MWGGDDDIVFDRVTGSTQTSGSVIFRLTSDPNQTKNITISSSGKIFLSGDQPTLFGTRVADTRHVHYDLGWSIENSVTATLFFTGTGFPGPDTTEDILVQDYISGGKFDWSGTIVVDGSGQVMRIHTHLLDPFNSILSVHRELDENDRPVDVSFDGNLITSYDQLGNVTVGPFGGTMDIQ